MNAVSAAAIAADPAATALAAALELPDASFVIFRRGLLIEFKTDLLPDKLGIYEEGRHRSWQIGSFDGHHCHPDLAAVVRVLFDAEPVSCQGGRLNYTVWFLAAADCGNPYRPEGLFSVTLNRPYHGDGSVREDIVAAVHALYQRLRGLPLVSASPAFLTTLPMPAGASASAAAAA